MPLEVNAQFNQFVQFAQDQAKPATSKAIARMGVEGPLGGRAIKAAERREGDSVRPFLPRSTVNKNANDAVRNLFRQSIANMFGGEVPQNSVGKLREARNTIARSMINLDFCEERKVLAGGKHENSQFALDRTRGLVVRLPNGAQLSADLGTARDELAARGSQ